MSRLEEERSAGKEEIEVPRKQHARGEGANKISGVARAAFLSGTNSSKSTNSVFGRLQGERELHGKGGGRNRGSIVQNAFGFKGFWRNRDF